MLFLSNMNDDTNQRLNFLRSRIGHPMNDSISPFGRWLNGTIRAVEYGKLVADFVVREEMTNPAGTLHGGAATAVLDDLIGTTVFALGREYVYTSVNLTIDFLHSAQTNEIVTVVAEVVRAGKNIIHCEGRIVSADDKLIAKCTTNMIQTSVRLTL